MRQRTLKLTAHCRATCLIRSSVGIAANTVRRWPCFIVALAGMSCLPAVADEVSVTTQRYDNARTGQNLSETLLNTSTVSSGRFGKLFIRAVDDEIYAQPLYVPMVSTPTGTRNVLYVATVNNTVFAFDADDPDAGQPLWKRNLTPAMPTGARPVKAHDVGQDCSIRGTYRDFTENIGIVGTPVIDLGKQTIYFVARTKENDKFAQRLHALDIATGAPRPNSPVLITASAKGKGRGSRNGVLHFDPAIHNQRAALLLANGVVYVAWASHCDTGPYHGWIIGYDSSTLQQRFATVVTPDGQAGGIWQSNSGPSADTQGNLYLSVGDGTATAQTGGRDYGSAILKLSPSGTIIDWFIPFNFKELDVHDTDLGTTGVVPLPETNLLISGSKEGKVYLLDRRDLGHFRSRADDQILQSVKIAPGGIYGTPTFWHGPDGPHVYIWGSDEVGKMFRLRERRLDLEPVSETKASAARPGGSLVVSANGRTAGTGIVWALTGESDANWKSVPGVLRAFDAADLSHELWNSWQNGEQDHFGLLAKFNTPVVANGKVYVATFSKQVAVYGLLPDIE